MKKILLSISVFAILSANLVAQNPGTGGSSNANSQWRTTGNNAQNTDFIGTTNSTDLIFKTNNTIRGRVDAGGDLRWDGGGRVLINVPNPVANLMFQLNGDGVINGELTGNRGKFVKLLIQDLRPDTIHMDTNKVIHGHTRVLGDVKINGTLTGTDATFSGNLSSGSLRVNSLSGSGDRDVVVDANGNLKTTLPGGFGCTANSLNWTLGGNQIGPWMQYGFPAAGTCDNFDFVLKANSTNYVWLKTDGKLGLGKSNPNAKFEIETNGTVPAFNISNSGTDLFSVSHDGGTIIHLTNINPGAAVLTTTHANGSSFRILANGTGDITSSSSFSPHFGTGLGDNFAIYQGTPGSGIQHFYMAGGTGTSHFRTTDGNTSGTAFMIVNNQNASGTGINNQVLTVANDGATVIKNHYGTTSAPLTIQNSSGNSLFSISSTGEIQAASLAGSGNRNMVIDPQGKIIPGGSVLGSGIYWELGGTDVTGAMGSNVFPNNTIGPVDAGTDFVFITGGNTANNERMRITSAGNTYLTVNGAATKAFSIFNSAGPGPCTNENFIVYGDGKTFIGGHVLTGFTGALLQVSGQIAAKEVHVLAPSFWCDYVFNEDYKLRSLKDLENYYKKNKHLPDVPSETEVKQNGVDMATMDAVLLKKIEESTLYIVEQQKELDVMKAEMEKMKNENESMRKALEKLLKK